MPRYFMRDTPLQAMEQLMMSQPGQKPRGGGIYRSPFHYTPKDVACEYCQNYDRKHPCRLCECACLEERIEAGVLELNEFVRDCFAPSMGPQFRKRMHQQFRERKVRFFLSDAHRRRWTRWRERCWRLSDRNKAALFLLTAYESLWCRMVWKCGNDGFDFQSVRLGGIEPELYSVYQAAKAIAVGCCNITLADLASPELVTDEAFHLITGALLMAKYASKYALSERLACGECGTLYRRCTWTRNGEKRVVWRCVSRLDYGKKYCHNSPTLDEAPLQQAILTALNTAMADKNSLIRQITDAMETEIIPFPGGTMSLGDIERRLRELEQQFQTLLEKATDDPAAYGGQFKEILDEQTFLKEKRSGILADNNEQTKANQRIKDAAQTLENASPHITEWDESAIRQLVETVKVLSKDEIAVTLKGGIEICQKIMY